MGDSWNTHTHTEQTEAMTSCWKEDGEWGP